MQNHYMPILDVTQHGTRRVDHDAIVAQVARVLSESGRHVQSVESPRFDGVGVMGTDGVIGRWRRQHFDPEIIRGMEAKGLRMREDVLREAARFDSEVLGIRVDDFNDPGVTHFSRDLEFVHAEVLEAQEQPLNGRRLFASDTSVPLGPRKHIVQRKVMHGEAVIHQGQNSGFGAAKVTRFEEEFRVAYVVSSVDVNYFDTLTNNWARVNQLREDLAAARELIDQKVNRIIWKGDADAGLYGVLTYPHMPKRIMPVPFTAASDPQEIALSLHALANQAWIASGGTMRPDTMVLSQEIAQFLAIRKHQLGGGTDTSILDFFMKGQVGGGIQRIEVAAELADLDLPGIPAGSGYDGILVYKDNKRSVANVDVAGTTPLPVYDTSPLTSKHVMFSAVGGIVMRNMNNALGLVRVR